MKLKGFKWNDRHYQNSQEKLYWNSGLNYTDNLYMRSTFEAFRLIVLAQINFTKVVLFPQAQLKQDKCKGFIFHPDKLYVYIVILIPVCCVIFVLFPVRHTDVCEFV